MVGEEIQRGHHRSEDLAEAASRHEASAERGLELHFCLSSPCSACRWKGSLSPGQEEKADIRSQVGVQRVLRT